MQAADKDVEMLKKTRNSEAIESSRRYAALESKVIRNPNCLFSVGTGKLRVVS